EDDVIVISSEKVEGFGDWNSLEFQDTAKSGQKKDTKAMVFYQIETYDGEINLGVEKNMISNEYAIKLCLEHEVKRRNKVVKKELIVALKGGIYFVKFIKNQEKDDVEPGVIFGRSFLRMTKEITDVGVETITIYPDIDPLIEETKEEEKSNDDWDHSLDFNIDDIPLLGEEGLSPFVCKMGKKTPPTSPVIPDADGQPTPPIASFGQNFHFGCDNIEMDRTVMIVMSDLSGLMKLVNGLSDRFDEYEGSKVFKDKRAITRLEKGQGGDKTTLVAKGGDEESGCEIIVTIRDDRYWHAMLGDYFFDVQSCESFHTICCSGGDEMSGFGKAIDNDPIMSCPFDVLVKKLSLGLRPRYTSCFSRRCPILNCFNFGKIVPAFLKELIGKVHGLQVPLLELSRFEIPLGELEITSSGWPFAFAIPGHVAHIVASITLDNARSYVMQAIVGGGVMSLRFRGGNIPFNTSRPSFGLLGLSPDTRDRLTYI
nr:hypothetical protein [Tanacetum cinerariifolium]